MSPRQFLRIFCIVLAAHAATAAAADLYVKPDGDDDRSGTRLDQAFATIGRAQAAVRAMQPLEEDVTVHIAPGLYLLDETLAFTEADSAPDGKRIAYRTADPAKKPRLSGGRLIRGAWKDEGDGLYSIDAGEGNFRQLYVNGKLATCAREPDEGEWRKLKQWEPITSTVRLQGSGILDHWKRMEQVEFVVKKHWGMSRLHVKWWGTYDGDDVFAPKTDLEFKQAHVPPKAAGQVYFFENALELLDQPGEWYLDRQSRRLYYRPRPDETPATAEVIAPRLERLVEMNGTANVTLDGLVFEHANWLYPDGDHGYVGCQANVHWDGWRTNPGAVHLTDTRDVRFTNNRVRNTTAAGLVLVKGTRRTLIEGNAFTEIGDTPIVVYSEKDKEPAESDQCCDDAIRNNVVSGFGRHNFAASGICVSVATRCTVEHNEVCDGGYAGITYGYFSVHDSPAAGSRIQFNHIHHVMRELDDGAGIYVFVTKFPRSDSTLLVYRNFIHDVYRGPTAERNPVAAIYLDEGAAGVTLRENVLRKVGNTIHLNTGNAGKENETKPQEQVYDGNTDENAAWEEAAGLEPEYAHLCLRPDKPPATFESARLIHHWPLDGDYRDIVAGKVGTGHGGAKFDDQEAIVGSACLRLDGKAQWASLPDVELGDRFTIALWVKLPEKAFGERAIFATPGLRLYSAVDIGKSRELLRTEVFHDKGHRTAATLDGVLPRGRWNHILITFDRRHGAQRLYVNGQDRTKTDYLGDMLFPVKNTMDLGRYSPEENQRWRDLDGWIDDVRIYRGHLRIGEIQSLAARRAP